MARFNYTQAKSDAQEIISFFGESATVYTPATDDYENGFGEIVAGSDAVIITGLANPLLPYSSDTKTTSYEADNVKSGDMYIYFDSSTLCEVGMLHDANGKTWRVQAVSTITSRDDINVLQKLMLRS